jgi:hypothetical protein
MSFIWNDNMREKREANANATWRALIRDRPRGDGTEQYYITGGPARDKMARMFLRTLRWLNEL